MIFFVLVVKLFSKLLENLFWELSSFYASWSFSLLPSPSLKPFYSLIWQYEHIIWHVLLSIVFNITLVPLHKLFGFAHLTKLNPTFISNVIFPHHFINPADNFLRHLNYKLNNIIRSFVHISYRNFTRLASIHLRWNLHKLFLSLSV